MMKAKMIGALALSVFMGLGAISPMNVSAQESSAQTPGKLVRQEDFSSITDSLESVMSYTDKESGKTFVSEDNGATWISEEEYEKNHKAINYEWWTYDEYKTWLEQEKKTLQEMADEHTEVKTSKGSFLWTQEMTDQYIAEYEQTLNDIKNGLLVSKSVDGDKECMTIFNSNWVGSAVD